MMPFISPTTLCLRSDRCVLRFRTDAACSRGRGWEATTEVNGMWCLGDGKNLVRHGGFSWFCIRRASCLACWQGRKWPETVRGRRRHRWRFCPSVASLKSILAIPSAHRVAVTNAPLSLFVDHDNSPKTYQLQVAEELAPSWFLEDSTVCLAATEAEQRRSSSPVTVPTIASANSAITINS